MLGVFFNVFCLFLWHFLFLEKGIKSFVSTLKEIVLKRKAVLLVYLHFNQTIT